MGSIPQTQEVHGCPFRHYSSHQLSTLLNSMSIGKKNVKRITEETQKGRFNLACVKHFEALHPNYKDVEGIQLDDLCDHANAWFQGSRNYYEKKGIKRVMTVEVGNERKTGICVRRAGCIF